MTQQSSEALSCFIGPYECLAKIGAGGMGRVYKARHRDSHAFVAIKVASERVVREPQLAKRFQLEYQAASEHVHPRLVRALDFDRHDDVPYLVMEYVDGSSLDQVLRTEGKLAECRALRMAREIGDVLQFLHQRRIIHRDIKPGNILMSKSAGAKLADLGLVKNLEQEHDITHSRTGLGTLEYAAPEQFDDAKHADPRADVYSFGATLFAALTGQHPFGTGGQVTILGRKLHNAFTPLTELLPGADPRLEEAIVRALQADPDRRPPTVADFLSLLTNLHGTGPCEASVNWDERRGSVRWPVELSSTCRSAHQPRVNEMAAVVQDISANGLCLRLSRRFEKGAILEVCIPGKNSMTLDVKKLIQTRWIRQLAPAVWLMGGTFTTPLAPDELEAFCFDGSPVTSML